jgi:hypothetical protein
VSDVESSRRGAADAGAPPWTSATWTARIHALGGVRETASLRSSRSDQAVSPDSGFPFSRIRDLLVVLVVALRPAVPGSPGRSGPGAAACFDPNCSALLRHAMAAGARGYQWAAPTPLRAHGPLATGEELEERRRRRKRRLANLPCPTSPLSLAASPGHHPQTPQWGPPPAQLAPVRVPGEPGGFSIGQHSPGVPRPPCCLICPAGPLSAGGPCNLAAHSSVK